ncbi:SGNH/GDSL hydrolase family protein [Granulicella arctica]|uniref:Lysophospholipase L1-like esterase n=1 Tax=Granulicella arctica TaxID=940613 RepID=A0A7Y9TFV2_9BACT|nr:SGNH/GDSL hydrolase family protein [Granulicella arctica]NYF78744.1 lysophospholipase L1-like esterase [Granulicella arctica]
MKMNKRSLKRLGRGLPALSLAIAACSSSSPTSSASTGSTSAQTANAGNFANTVFLGDSLTAGYQSSSLLDIQQVHGWAPLVAKQAKFNIIQPLIAYPGAPNVLQLVSPGPPPVIATAPGATTGRENYAVQITDLAVPGAYVNDVANTVPVLDPTSEQEQLNRLVLGSPGLDHGDADSQASFAVKAEPTTIFLWIGNNDALIANLTGSAANMTSVEDFATQYKALMAKLTGQTNAHLVIGNIPDVTQIPYLTPAATILAMYAQATGLSKARLSSLFGIVPGDYITPEGTTQITAILAGTQKAPLDDIGVLTAAEAVTVQQRVAAFNQVIAASASTTGATLVDIHALFAQVAANGLTVNGYTGTSAFLGGFFSLDGIHPTNTGYAVVANKFIDTMNANIGTKIAPIALEPIAATDPLWPPNLSKATAEHVAIPANAGAALNDLLLPTDTSKSEKKAS